MEPIIVWVRRDLRLYDHAALSAASSTGRPVIPVFIYDDVVQGLGAAPKWRFGLGVARFQKTLQGIGSNLVLRRGQALEVLSDLITETGAKTVYWQRAYDPDSINRDKAIKEKLKCDGIQTESFSGALLIEPWIPQTKAGSSFKVFTPYWRSVYSSMQVDNGTEKISTLFSPEIWPKSDNIKDWGLATAMHRGANVVGDYLCVGEDAALDRLDGFMNERVHSYHSKRDLPSVMGTSGLSENLTYGEISPKTIYHRSKAAIDQGDQGADAFLRQLFWREFSYHLLWFFPDMEYKCWRSEWDEFGWSNESNLTVAWKRGITGEPFVDAAMRELYTTGTMHNRARMIVGSYLTKHLQGNWRIGLRWFEECLVDWDPAANAMGWQWIAGCGPDAAPYFRVFNPALQAEKFDKSSEYRARWLDADTSEHAKSYFTAIPKSWNLTAKTPYPDKIVSLEQGRNRALEAYKAFKTGQ